MVDGKSRDGCPIIALAHKVISQPHSREAFLQQCRTIKQCDQFLLALMDRASHGFRAARDLMGCSRSLYSLLQLTSKLCQVSRIFHSRLNGMGHLTTFSRELSQFSVTVEATDGAPKVALMVPPHVLLIQLALNERTHSQIRRNFSALSSGDFLSTLLRATIACASSPVHANELAEVLRVVNILRHFMVYPKVFGFNNNWSTPPVTQDIRHNPSALATWKSFLRLHHRAMDAYELLKKRPTVYICDYPFVRSLNFFITKKYC